MARVYRGLLHAGAWLLTTALAVTLSWFGVHSVLRSTAYDLPRTLPITVPSEPAVPEPTATSDPPEASSTHRPRPTTPPPPHPTTSVAVPPKTPPGTPRPTPSATVPTRSAGDVHSYPLEGGQVVLALTRTDASLVTATPTADWKMQVWTESGWLRVTFTSADGAASSSLFCTWNGHPPSVDSYEDQG
jgi:hypothetical protein